MMKINLLLLLQLFLMLDGFSCVEQTCTFGPQTWSYVSVDLGTFHQCKISGVLLTNENETVKTITSNNSKSNNEVTSVYYESPGMKFIPNSIFIIFPYCEVLVLGSTGHLEVMKPEYLKGATKLRLFYIHVNDVTRLDAYLFIEAPNLVHIRISDGKLASIHRWAFNGLTKLQGVHLQNSKISNLNPETFSHLINLQILDLSGSGNCLNKKFENANNKLSEIEGDIKSACVYIFSAEELQKMKLKKTMQKEELDICKKTNQLVKEQQETISNLTELQTNSYNLIQNLTEINVKLVDNGKKDMAEISRKLEEKTLEYEKILKEKESAAKLEEVSRIDDIELKIQEIQVLLNNKLSDCKTQESENLKKTQIQMDAMVDTIKTLQEKTATIQTESFKSEIKSLNNHLMLVKIVNDQKTSLDDHFKSCKASVEDVQNNIQKIDERFGALEVNN